MHATEDGSKIQRMISSRPIRKFVRISTSAAIAVCTMVGFAGAASAKTMTTHTLSYFEKQSSTKSFHVNGQPADPNAQPVAGDYFVTTAEDYVGDHLKHDAKATATDAFSCTITTATQKGFTGICYGVFAIGSYAPTLGDFHSTVPITVLD